VCPECATWPAALTHARYAYVLRPPADDLVHALKYEGWRELAALMGDAVARLVPEGEALRSQRTVVVPVPTTAERMRGRGYNQAELLAARVAEARGMPLRRALVRPGARRSQTALTPAERRENVRGAFAPAPDARDAVEGARVLLVDDVLTTGATASEAASVLADVGAERVTLLTYARALATVPGNGR
jgi:ComF family protein